MSGERYGMLYLDDCRVPSDNVLLWENGFAKMMSVVNIERLGMQWRFAEMCERFSQRAR